MDCSKSPNGGEQLENGRADVASYERRLRRRERELHAIHRMTTALHAKIRLDDLVQQALDVSIETLNASGGTIYLHDPKKQVLVFKYVVGATPEITRKLQGMEMPDTQGIAGEVFQTGEGRITLDVTKDSRHNRGVDEKTHYVTKSIVTVPLRSMGGHPVGVMQILNRRDGDFDEEDLELLEIVAAQAASAIETVRLYEDARRASVINLIGDISHDVKNLLTPVVSGTQTLEMLMDAMWQDWDGILPRVPADERAALEDSVASVREFYKEAMEMVYDGSRDAQERVREIADAIKGIISEPHFEPTDFRERAEAVARVLRLVAGRKGITIDLSGIQAPEPVEFDRKGIYNALYNLINNAIPETPEGGRISVSAQPIDLDGRPGVEIRVADTGRGMPEHIRERMFTENAISTKPGGTGLGTRIVKNVVDAHHGTIRVESEPGKGTVFTIRIPRQQPGSRPAEPAA